MGIRERILARRAAYRTAFEVMTTPDASWRTRALARVFAALVGDAEAYRTTLSGVQAERVLADLRRYCRATAPTFTREDPHTTSFLEGRRDVWLRIATHLQVTEDQVYGLVEPQTENEYG